MQLVDKYRPAKLSDVVGQSKTVRALQLMLERGFSSCALYFVGASGTGKTTCARAVVNELHIDDSDVFTIAGADVTADFIRDLREKFSLSTWGESGWKAIIIDEAHGMSRQAVQLLLPYLEELPSKRLFLFTSTEPLDGDIFGNFTGPIASRCKVFELKSDSKAMAGFACGVADCESLNAGNDETAFERLLSDCVGNLRMTLQKIEAGVMLEPYISKPTVSTPATPAKKPVVISPDRLKAGPQLFDREREIADEIERGKKFFKGSKKHNAHLERLKELQAK